MLPQRSIDYTSTDNERFDRDNAYFTELYNHILDTKLTPDNIDDYADKALEDLIDLINQASRQYEHNPTIPTDMNKREHEEHILAQFGLINIEQTLDHIANISEDLRDIDNIINDLEAKSTERRDIILPPDERSVNISPSNGSFREKNSVSRLKTTLFAIQQEFGYDLRDANNVQLNRGVVTDDMMRNESYTQITLPEQNRTIFVCDEEGNATFIFDTTKTLDQTGFSSNELTNCTKQELAEFIYEHPDIGRRIVYSKNFVDKMVGTLTEDIPINNNEPTIAKNKKYLQPTKKPDTERGNPEKAPEGYLTLRALADEIGVDRTTLLKIVDQIEDLGEVEQYRSRNGVTFFYSPEQQDKIRRAVPEKAPEGYLTLQALADEIGVYRTTLRKVIDQIEDLGKVEKYRSSGGSGITSFYSPEQQDKIRQAVPEKAPEGYLTLRALADEIGTARETLLKIVDQIEDLGEVKQYRSRSGVTFFYSPEQQDKIRRAVPEKAPEGYLTHAALANELDVGWNALRRIVDQIEDLGEVKEYISNGGITLCYSPDQQDKIRRAVPEKAPEGYLTLQALADEIGVDRTTLLKIVDQIEDLGEVKKYRPNGRGPITLFYSPRQQDKIRQATTEKYKSSRLKLGQKAVKVTL